MLTLKNAVHYAPTDIPTIFMGSYARKPFEFIFGSGKQVRVAITIPPFFVFMQTTLCALPIYVLCVFNCIWFFTLDFCRIPIINALKCFCSAVKCYQGGQKSKQAVFHFIRIAKEVFFHFPSIPSSSNYKTPCVYSALPFYLSS